MTLKLFSDWVVVSSGQLEFSENVTGFFPLHSLPAVQVVVGISLGWALWASEIKKTLSLFSRHLLCSEEDTHGQIRMK